MSGALEISDRTLREIAVPRTNLIWVKAEAPVDKAQEVLLTAGVSRAPVAGSDVDDVVGVVHLRDLIGKTGVTKQFMRGALALPETVSVMKALAEMQAKRAQLAIVVDEYGGTEGIVTLEEVVGEIYDEFDPDIAAVERATDGSVVVGSFPIHDIHEIGINLPEGDYTTVAGLLMQRLGRMPRRGDIVREGRWSLEVTRVRGRTVEQVRIFDDEGGTPQGDLRAAPTD